MNTYSLLFVVLSIFSLLYYAGVFHKSSFREGINKFDAIYTRHGVFWELNITIHGGVFGIRQGSFLFLPKARAMAVRIATGQQSIL